MWYIIAVIAIRINNLCLFQKPYVYFQDYIYIKLIGSHCSYSEREQVYSIIQTVSLTAFASAYILLAQAGHMFRIESMEWEKYGKNTEEMKIVSKYYHLPVYQSQIFIFFLHTK